MAGPWDKFQSESGPWQKFAMPEQTEAARIASEGGLPSAIVRKGMEGATGGFYDEAAGAVHALGDIATTDKTLSDFKELYRKRQQEYLDVLKETDKQFPVASTASKIGGFVLGPGKLVKGVKTAAALGGLTGLGESDAKVIDKKEYGKAALDTTLGMGAGAAGYKVGEAISSKLGKLFAPKAAQNATMTVESTGAPAASEVAERSGKISDIAKKVFGDAAPAKNSGDIIKAAKALTNKGEVPGYMLTEDRTRKALASSLLDSPTVGGAIERKKLDPILSAIKERAGKLSDEASGFSPYETGSSVKKAIHQKFKDSVEPAELIYKDIEKEFSKVPIEGRAFSRLMNALKKEYSTDYSGKTQSLIKNLEGTFKENVDDVGKLRQFRTQLGKHMEKTATDAEKDIINKTYAALTRERNRSILKYETNIPKKEGMLDALRTADGLYKDALRGTSKALGLDTSKRSAITSFLDETAPEQFVKQMFNKKDVGQLQNLKNAFPEEFNQLRTQELADLVNKSMFKGEVSPQKLVTNFNKYAPEVKELLLGEKAADVKNIETLLNALPPQVNPSGTARTLQLQNWMDIPSNLKSLVSQQVLTRGTPEAGAISDVVKEGLKDKMLSFPGVKATYQMPMSAAKDAISLKNVTPASSFVGAQGAKGITLPSRGIVPEVAKDPKENRGPQSQQIDRQRTLQKIAGTPYEAPLRAAAERGENSFAATYYLMSQQDPEFRMKMEDKKDER